MSLINRMLQDLDQRHVAESDQATATNEIRAVAPQKHGYPIWQFAVLVLLMVAGVLAWLLLRQQSVVSPPPPPGVAKPADAVVSLPVLKTDMQLEAPPAVLRAKNTEQAQPRQLPEQAVAMPREQGRAEIALPDAQIILPPAASGHAAVEKQFKELSPQQRAENEYRKAIGLMQNGRLVEATDSLQQAVKLDPYHLSARQMLAALLVEAKRPMEAEQTLLEGLKFSPEQSGFSMVLARLQAGRGDVNAALEALRKGLPHAREKADYHALYAALLQRQEQHAEAIEQYQAALRTAPNSGVWLMGLGISLQAENRNKEAEEAFTRARASSTLSAELKAFVEQRIKQLQ